MGIAAQGEISRNNALNRTIGDINTQEGQAITDFGNKATDINTSYQNSLTNAFNTIDQTLNTNLYNERIRQEELAAALARARYSSGGSSSSSGITKITNIPIAYQTGLQGVKNGNKVTYNVPDGNGGIVQATFDVGVNPYLQEQ